MVPTALSSKRTSKLISSVGSGSAPGFPTIFPTKPSDFVKEGSSFVPIASRPPGPASSTCLPPVIIDVISVVILSHSFFPPLSTLLPGAISISSPTTNFPCKRDPPITPPFKSFGLVPGLLTSKLLATYIKGSLLKSRCGVGILSCMACINTSMLAS